MGRLHIERGGTGGQKLTGQRAGRSIHMVAEIMKNDETVGRKPLSQEAAVIWASRWQQ